MRLRGIRPIQRLIGRVYTGFRSRAIILLYHRVANVPSDPQLLCVSPKHFGQHLEHLRKKYEVLGLVELVERLREGKLPRRAAVVTFDDGYLDNLQNAKPLLKRYEAPATVFVTTGHLRRDREFWWEELMRVLLGPGTLPKTISLEINGNNHQWDLDGGAHYTKEDYHCYRNWNVLMKETPTPRHAVYRSLHRLLRPLQDNERMKVLDTLVTLAGTDTSSRPMYRAMIPEEVIQLSEGGLVDIGAHSVTHPVLSTLDVVAQQTEVRESKTLLENVLNRPVVSFAYPYGARSDYTADTVNIVQDAGFALACSNFPGLVHQGTDCYQLPRFMVLDWDGETFARQVDAWFHT
jgi:peptidoglycan/xylan/chitin deacetylase (PgdA/CDA1 family)